MLLLWRLIGQRAELIAILNRLARAVAKYQDARSGLWYFNLAGTVSVAGLGGNPYRDGNYEYYLSEKVVTNDPKGIGAFLLAATEMEAAANTNRVRGRRSEALQ